MHLVDCRRHVPIVSIRDQCARDYMYGKELELERAFGELESAAAAVIRSIMSGNPAPDWGTSEFATLLVFMHFQWFRTPVALARQNAWDGEMIRQLAKSDPRLPPELRDPLDRVRVSSGMQVAEGLFLAARHWVLLEDLRMKVLRNISDLEFIIGDAPVVLHNQWCRRLRGWGSLGLACSGLQLLFPVSPEHLILLYDPDTYDVEGATEIVSVSDDEEVHRLNYLQFAAADKAVFYRSAAMAPRVAEIPASVREDRLGVRASRFVSEADENSQLFVFSNVPMNVDLRRGVIGMRPRASLTPLPQRMQRWRPEAYAKVRAMNRPERHHARRGGCERYRRVE